MPFVHIIETYNPKLFLSNFDNIASVLTPQLTGRELPEIRIQKYVAKVISRPEDGNDIEVVYLTEHKHPDNYSSHQHGSRFL